MSTQANFIKSKNRTTVLLLDGNVSSRSTLDAILKSDKRIDIVGATSDPVKARDIIVEVRPDFLLLDPLLKGFDGFEFIRRVTQSFPSKIIAIFENSEPSLVRNALALGAIAALAKPLNSPQMHAIKQELFQYIFGSTTSHASRSSGTLTQGFEIPLIGIASSTGGTEALKRVIDKLPANLPPIFMVQHMLASFTKHFADSLNHNSSFPIVEATNGEKISPGIGYLCPGDSHMEIDKQGINLYIKLHKAPPLHNVRPSADYLFRSMARISGRLAIGTVLTGMGRDGAEGLQAMHKAGSYNIAQDEATSVVFGMPKAAIDLGAIDSILPIHEIASAIVGRARRLR
ncbi:MAG: chemotaxis protein CheB [Chitinophagaceae bacterium]|nr:chemotaxis protein CheB [Oligoflexus sp.]